MSILKYKLYIFHIIAASTVLFFMSCGGNNLELDLKYGPVFSPVNWFIGKHNGLVLIRDRNGNLKETGQIQRDCGVKSTSQKGQCQDQIHFVYQNINLTDLVKWQLVHPDRKNSALQYQDYRGSFESMITKRSVVVQVVRLLPDSSKKEAQCEVKFTILPNSSQMIQTERCQTAGFYLGETMIVWHKMAEVLK